MIQVPMVRLNLDSKQLREAASGLIGITSTLTDHEFHRVSDGEGFLTDRQIAGLLDAAHVLANLVYGIGEGLENLAENAKKAGGDQ